MRESDELAEAVARRLIERRETVAVAESAAGGLISAALLGVAGASAYYKGGFVGYTSEARIKFAGLTAEFIQEHRSVTEPHTLALARGIRERLGATWGISETGAAGPTGNRYGDPVGRVTLAVSGPVERTQLLDTGHGDRRRNMEDFTVATLKLFLEVLS